MAVPPRGDPIAAHTEHQGPIVCGGGGAGGALKVQGPRRLRRANSGKPDKEDPGQQREASDGGGWCRERLRTPRGCDARAVLSASACEAPAAARPERL